MNRNVTEGSRILRLVDWVADGCGSLGVGMLIFVTAALSYEACARYFFHAPTSWAQDVSVTLQIWMTYLGMAMVLKDRKMIRITALLGVAPVWVRYACEFLALGIILAFSAMATVKGWDMLLDSIRLGRRQPTVLALPNWIAELPVVVGFAFLSLQSLAELIRLPFRGPPSFSIESELESEGLDPSAGGRP